MATKTSGRQVDADPVWMPVEYVIAHDCSENTNLPVTFKLSVPAAGVTPKLNRVRVTVSPARFIEGSNMQVIEWYAGVFSLSFPLKVDAISVSTRVKVTVTEQGGTTDSDGAWIHDLP